MRFPWASLSHGSITPIISLSQPFLLGETLQFLNRFLGPALDSVQSLHISLVLDSPEQDPELQVWTRQHWVEGRIISLDLLANLFLMKPRKSSYYSCFSAHWPHSFYGYLQFYAFLWLGISLFWSSRGFCERVSPVTNIWYSSHSFQFPIMCKLAEEALCPTVQLSYEDVKHFWPQYQSPVYTSVWLIIGLSAQQFRKFSVQLSPVI